jgi:type I restriction enzyme R subunit
VRKSPYKAIIAFSGDKEYGGATVNESSINGFPNNAIEKTFRTDPY